MLLLLQEPHLTTLFELLEMLACFKPPSHTTEKDQEDPEVWSLTLSVSSQLWYLVVFFGFFYVNEFLCRAPAVKNFTSMQRICLGGFGNY